MSGVSIRLWFIRQTDKARLYSKTQPDSELDTIWVPLSIIEHTTKRGSEHVVTLPDWFIEKERL